MKKYFSVVLISALPSVFFYAMPVAADSGMYHLVISQVQITGGPGKTANDFVEIYNPADHDLDLQGMRLVKRTKTGETDTLLKSWTDSAIVKAHGFYLWANADFTEIAVTPDVTTSGTMAADNGVALRSGPNDTGAIVDSMAWGLAANIFVEGAVFATNPEAGQSLERKPGGDLGNGQDTNDNSQDFFLQNIAHPRNFQSSQVPPLEPPPEGGNDNGNGNPPPPPPADGGASGQPQLALSEFVPNPKGVDSGHEWIEFFNSGTAAADLSGWILDDDDIVGNPGKDALILGPGTSVPSSGFLVVTIPKGKFVLNNSGGDAVRLFDATKTLRLRQYYHDAAREGYSYAKNATAAWAWTEILTPGEPNQFAPELIYSTSLRISEVLPDPVSEETDEFIEIQNFGLESINLEEWVVADKAKRFTISGDNYFDTEIPPGGFLVLDRDTTGIALNNLGEEEVSLFNPAGELVDRIGFSAASREGQSYSWEKDRVYRWTLKPTPGAPNEFVAPPLENEMTALKNKIEQGKKNLQEGKEKLYDKLIELKEIHNLNLGEKVTTTGIVGVEPGIFDEQVIYLTGSGIRVFLQSLPGNNLAVGTRIALSGEVGSYHNELQLKVTDPATIKILETGIELAPHDIKTGEVGESTEGYLVRVSGQVTRNEGETFFLDDGTGEAKIYLKDSTGIEKPKIRKGDTFTVVGFVSQYDETYRVLPRYQSDLTLGRVAGLAIKGSALPRTGNDFWLILASFCLVMGFQNAKFWKKFQRKLALNWVKTL